MSEQQQQKAAARRAAKPERRLPENPTAPEQKLRMLLAMADVASEKGYVQVSVADVIARAGVSRRTFYEHFADKRECIVETYEHCIVAFRTPLTDAMVEFGDVPMSEQLPQLVDIYMRAIAAEPGLAGVYFIEFYAVDAPLGRRRAEVMAWFAELLRGIHGRLGSEGIPMREFSEFDSLMLVGAVSSLVTAEVDAGDVTKLADVARELYEYMLREMVA